MTTEVTLDADIEGFEASDQDLYAVVLLYGKDRSGNLERWDWEDLEYPRDLIPERGRYSPANFEVTISVTAGAGGVDQMVGPVESVAEFEAEVVNIDTEHLVFDLRDVDSGDLIGELRLDPNHLPRRPDDVGDICYVTIRMEYLHEQTVDVLEERLGESEEDIERRRENTQELFEQLEEEYL